MSEEFEVKGPHEEALEEEPTNRFGARLAVMTAIMATAGALMSYEASVTLGEAFLDKNEESILKTQAANQWSLYQAKSTKQNIAELAVKLTSGTEANLSRTEAKRYEAEKDVIKSKADDLERQSLEADRRSEKLMHTHHRWATGTTAMQIAISMAAIALLTRRRWVQYASLTSAAIGLGFALLAGISA